MVRGRFPTLRIVVHVMGPILGLMPIVKNRDGGTGERGRRVGVEEFIMCGSWILRR